MKRCGPRGGPVLLQLLLANFGPRAAVRFAPRAAWLAALGEAPPAASAAKEGGA
jgi:hypothetical protein